MNESIAKEEQTSTDFDYDAQFDDSVATVRRDTSLVS